MVLKTPPFGFSSAFPKLHIPSSPSQDPKAQPYNNIKQNGLLNPPPNSRNHPNSLHKTQPIPNPRPQPLNRRLPKRARQSLPSLLPPLRIRLRRHRRRRRWRGGRWLRYPLQRPKTNTPTTKLPPITGFAIRAELLVEYIQSGLILEGGIDYD